MEKRNIKLVYSYDGSEFFGFQRQPGLRTVQGELERVLKIVFKDEIELVSAGRTDRGVHAKMQVSNFFTENKIPLNKIKKALNSILPKDITILDVSIEDENFSSRFSAKYRSYEYYISEERDVFKNRYVTFVEEKLDLEKLNNIAKILEGKHDFKNFRLSDCGSNTTIREIYDIKFLRVDEKTIKLYVKGSAFLKSQIRIIVGTILAIYFGKKEKNYLERMLKETEVEFAKIVAEPNGLHLCEIGY